MSFDLDKRIQIKDKVSGTIRYVGSVDGKRGEWVGIELDEPVGSNDGSYLGKRYFSCQPRHGVFIRSTRLLPYNPSGFEADPMNSYIFLEKEDLLNDYNKSAEYTPERKYFPDAIPKYRSESFSTAAPLRHELPLNTSACKSLVERLVGLRTDLDSLQKRLDKIKISSVSLSKHSYIRSLVKKICEANLSQNYKEAYAYYTKFKAAMAEFGISV